MPNSLQCPLERQRDLQRKWGRLLQRTASSIRAPVNACISGGGTSLLRGLPAPVDTTPPRNRNGDDEEDREPAVIREPDPDE